MTVCLFVCLLHTSHAAYKAMAVPTLQAFYEYVIWSYNCNNFLSSKLTVYLIYYCLETVMM